MHHTCSDCERAALHMDHWFQANHNVGLGQRHGGQHLLVAMSDGTPKSSSSEMKDSGDSLCCSTISDVTRAPAKEKCGHWQSAFHIFSEMHTYSVQEPLGGRAVLRYGLSKFGHRGKWMQVSLLLVVAVGHWPGDWPRLFKARTYGRLDQRFQVTQEEKWNLQTNQQRSKQQTLNQLISHQNHQ